MSTDTLPADDPRDTPHLDRDGDRWRGRPSETRLAETDDGPRSESRSSGGWQGGPSGELREAIEAAWRHPNHYDWSAYDYARFIERHFASRRPHMTDEPTTAAGPWTCLYDDYNAETVFVARDPQRSQSPLVEGLTIEQGTAIAAALNEAEARQQDTQALREALGVAITRLREGQSRWSYPVEGPEAEASWIVEWLIVHSPALAALPLSTPSASRSRTDERRKVAERRA